MHMQSPIVRTVNFVSRAIINTFLSQSRKATQLAPIKNKEIHEGSRYIATNREGQPVTLL